MSAWTSVRGFRIALSTRAVVKYNFILWPEDAFC